MAKSGRLELGNNIVQGICFILIMRFCLLVCMALSLHFIIGCMLYMMHHICCIRVHVVTLWGWRTVSWSSQRKLDLLSPTPTVGSVSCLFRSTHGLHSPLTRLQGWHREMGRNAVDIRVFWWEGAAVWWQRAYSGPEVTFARVLSGLQGIMFTSVSVSDRPICFLIYRSIGREPISVIHCSLYLYV